MSNQAPELAKLPANYEHLLQLLRERDRLLQDYVASLSFSDEQYGEWNRANWKDYARNQLALMQAVRPLTYADYRNRIRILSPTFGIVGPYRLASGWILESEAQLRREAESGAVLALLGEEEPTAEPLPEPTAEALPLPVLPMFVEPETPEPEPLPPIIEEPLMSVEEFHAAPDFEGVFLAPTATVQEATRLFKGLFIVDKKGYDAEDNHTLSELYQRKRALLLAHSAPTSNISVAAADYLTERLAAIERRKHNRAKLQANRADLVNALNNPLSVHE